MSSSNSNIGSSTSTFSSNFQQPLLADAHAHSVTPRAEATAVEGDTVVASPAPRNSNALKSQGILLGLPRPLDLQQARKSSTASTDSLASSPEPSPPPSPSRSASPEALLEPAEEPAAVQPVRSPRIEIDKNRPAYAAVARSVLTYTLTSLAVGAALASVAIFTGGIAPGTILAVAGIAAAAAALSSLVMAVGKAFMAPAPRTPLSLRLVGGLITAAAIEGATLGFAVLTFGTGALPAAAMLAGAGIVGGALTWGFVGAITTLTQYMSAEQRYRRQVVKTLCDPHAEQSLLADPESDVYKAKLTAKDWHRVFMTALTHGNVGLLDQIKMVQKRGAFSGREEKQLYRDLFARLPKLQQDQTWKDSVATIIWSLFSQTPGAPKDHALLIAEMTAGKLQPVHFLEEQHRTWLAELMPWDVAQTQLGDQFWEGWYSSLLTAVLMGQGMVQHKRNPDVPPIATDLMSREDATLSKFEELVAKVALLNTNPSWVARVRPLVAFIKAQRQSLDSNEPDAPMPGIAQRRLNTFENFEKAKELIDCADTLLFDNKDPSEVDGDEVAAVIKERPYDLVEYGPRLAVLDLNYALAMQQRGEVPKFSITTAALGTLSRDLPAAERYARSVFTWFTRHPESQSKHFDTIAMSLWGLVSTGLDSDSAGQREAAIIDQTAHQPTPVVNLEQRFSAWFSSLFPQNDLARTNLHDAMHRMFRPEIMNDWYRGLFPKLYLQQSLLMQETYAVGDKRRAAVTLLPSFVSAREHGADVEFARLIKVVRADLQTSPDATRSAWLAKAEKLHAVAVSRSSNDWQKRFNMAKSIYDAPAAAAL